MSKRIRFIAVNNTTAAKLRKALAASEVIKLPKYVAGRVAGYGDRIKRAIAGNSMGLTHEHAAQVCFHMPTASDYDIYAVSADAASSFILMDTDFDIERMFANSIEDIEVYEQTGLHDKHYGLGKLYNAQLEQQGTLRYLHTSMDVADLIAAGAAMCARYVELIKHVQAEIALTWDNKW